MTVSDRMLTLGEDRSYEFPFCKFYMRRILLPIELSGSIRSLPLAVL